MVDRQGFQETIDFPAGLAGRPESVARDLIAGEVDAAPMDIGYLHDVEGTLSEWACAVDDDAYRDLWKANALAATDDGNG